MANLSITTAWNEMVEFLKRESRLVLPVALLLIALPGAAMQLAMPTPQPGQSPEPGLWLLLIPVVAVASMVGTIAIAYLALRRGASVGEALQVGLRRFIMLFLASLLVGLGLFAVFFILVMLFGAGAVIGGDPAALVQALLPILLIFLVVAIAVWVRLMLMTPVAAVESGGPIALIRRSWQLTAGHFWRLLGFVLLLLLAAVVAMLVVTMVIGLIVVIAAGPPEPGSTSWVVMAIVSAFLQALFSTVLIVLLARIYGQLSGGTPAEVFA